MHTTTTSLPLTSNPKLMTKKRVGFSITGFSLNANPFSGILIDGQSSSFKSYTTNHSYRFLVYYNLGAIWFRFGCERYPLSRWSPSLIRKLCKKHAQPDFEAEIISIVRLVRNSLQIIKSR